MSNTKSKTSKSTVSKSVAEPVESVLSVETAEAVSDGAKYRIRKSLDPNTIVTVKNGFQGCLVYKSRRTKESFVWEGFGDEQDMDLQELKNAKNSSKAFFVNNWFLIDDPEILDYLGVTQFYKYALNYNSFDDLFNKTPNEIKKIVSRLSNGQKKSVAYRAKELISEGVIDSIKVINVLEESLAIELIERDG